jgi:hypothetical protein
LDCSGRVQESPRNPASKRTSSFMISYAISHHYNDDIIYDITCSRIIWYERPGGSFLESGDHLDWRDSILPWVFHCRAHIPTKCSRRSSAGIYRCG